MGERKIGLPALGVYRDVLYDLKVRKTTGSLEELLSELPDDAPLIVQAPASKTSTIRQIMELLLECEEWLPYFQRMLDFLSHRILLHEATDEAPHLLTSVVEHCNEAYVLEVYEKIAELENIKQEACSAYQVPFRKAYDANKFKLIEHMYTKGFEHNIPVDRAVCRGHHPLIYATYFALEIESSVKFAQAYLCAARNQDNRGIPRSCEAYDPSCVYSDTVLANIAQSGRCDIMRLVIQQGANVNALDREGRSLLEISEGEMEKLLSENGAKKGERKDYLLNMAILGVKQQDPQRLTYITELLQTDPRYTRAIYTETKVLWDYTTVDLVSEAIAYADIEALQLLLPVVRNRIYSNQTILAMKRAIRYCMEDIYVDCKRIAEMLRLFDENGIRFPYEVEQKVFVLQADQDLVYCNRCARLNEEDETVTDICYLLCKIFRLDPVDIHYRAVCNITRPDWGETMPSRESVVELFVSRGWDPQRSKR